MTLLTNAACGWRGGVVGEWGACEVQVYATVMKRRRNYAKKRRIIGREIYTVINRNVWRMWSGEWMILGNFLLLGDEFEWSGW